MARLLDDQPRSGKARSRHRRSALGRVGRHAGRLILDPAIESLTIVVITWLPGGGPDVDAVVLEEEGLGAFEPQPLLFVQ